MSIINGVECVLDAKAVIGESPFWDGREKRLYWVDIRSKEVHCFDPASGRDDVYATPEEVGCLALRKDGGLVLGLESGFFFYDLKTGSAERIAEPEPERKTNRFNDGKPDRKGRFWAGSMDNLEQQTSGQLYMLDIDLNCTAFIDDIDISNGLCWSPDSRVMYHADSKRQKMWAWDFDIESGRPTNRRVFVEFNGAETVDGATVDREGFVWIAVWGGWRVARYDAQGKLDRVIDLPVQCPTCPAFGGPNMRTLYVTSASIAPSDPAKEPLAGGLFACDAGVEGIPEMRFQG